MQLPLVGGFMLRILAAIQIAISVSAFAGGFDQMPSIGTEGSGRGIVDQNGGQQGQFGQFGQQSGFQQMQQQFQQIQQASAALTAGGGKGRGAENGSAEAGKAAQEAIKTASEKQSEDLKKAGESILSGVGSSPPKDEGVKKEVGEALKQLSTPQGSGNITELAKGVVSDIQALNAVQVSIITKIAEQFTAPPRQAPVPQKNPTLQNQIAASGLNPRQKPSNIFAEGLAQQSQNNVPHGTAFMKSQPINPGVMRGISSETIYNAPDSVAIPTH